MTLNISKNDFDIENSDECDDDSIQITGVKPGVGGNGSGDDFSDLEDTFHGCAQLNQDINLVSDSGRALLTWTQDENNIVTDVPIFPTGFKIDICISCRNPWYLTMSDF